MTTTTSTTQPRHYSLPNYDATGELPLHLLALPPLPTNDDDNDADGTPHVDMLAYGGTDGHVYLLPGSYNGAYPRSSPILLKSYDDIPRSMAISSNGLRLAIGFDGGETQIFSYDDNKKGNDVDKLGVRHHPFVNVELVNRAIDVCLSDSGNESEDEYNGGFFSQSQQEQPDSTSVKMFNGPRSELAIRHLSFDPRSTSGAYYLAIGSESADAPLRVVNVTSEESVGKENKVWLEVEGGDVCGGGGVRSLTYSNNTSSTNSSSDNDKKLWLTTLGTNGKINVFDVSSPLTLPESWDHVYSDFMQCVKPDVGSLGSDSADKACHVAWGQLQVSSGATTTTTSGKNDNMNMTINHCSMKIIMHQLVNIELASLSVIVILPQIDI